MQILAQPISLASFKQALCPRIHDAHKGMFGHVLVVGGDYGTAGAVRLTSEAALRAGAGLVSAATHNEHIAAIIADRSEIMCHGVESAKELNSLLEKVTVIAIGPGLGQSKWSIKLFEKILKAPQPKVIDADGLNLLAQFPQKSDHWILTPHPGEAARLLNCSTQEIQNDRVAAITALQKKYGGTIVLKGAGTLIMGITHTITICEAGNPGMASGGMGDALTGVIAGLLAQHFSLQHAAEIGVCVHAEAADLAATQGERGMLASDLMPFIRRLVNP